MEDFDGQFTYKIKVVIEFNEEYDADSIPDAIQKIKKDFLEQFDMKLEDSYIKNVNLFLGDE